MALRKFNNGEVFYSDDMDSLVAGSNMRFANAAARDATLVGGLAKTAGMQAVVTDERIAHRYHGAAQRWMPMPGTVMFSYVSTTAISVASADNLKAITTALTWNSTIGARNYSNWFNAGAFIPPAGTPQAYYEFSAGVAFSQTTNVAGFRSLNLTSGGSPIEQGSAWIGSNGASSNYIYLHVTGVIPVLAGSSVYLAVRNTNATAVQIGQSVDYPTYFSAKYLGM